MLQLLIIINCIFGRNILKLITMQKDLEVAVRIQKQSVRSVTHLHRITVSQTSNHVMALHAGWLFVDIASQVLYYNTNHTAQHIIPHWVFGDRLAETQDWLSGFGAGSVFFCRRLDFGYLIYSFKSQHVWSSTMHVATDSVQTEADALSCLLFCDGEVTP